MGRGELGGFRVLLQTLREDRCLLEFPPGGFFVIFLKGLVNADKVVVEVDGVLGVGEKGFILLDAGEVPGWQQTAKQWCKAAANPARRQDAGVNQGRRPASRATSTLRPP